jgi:peptidyl-prolyl cis-trans isomerase-like 4
LTEPLTNIANVEENTAKSKKSSVSLAHKFLRARVCTKDFTDQDSMSVILETSLGELTIDLFCKDTPKAAQNFLKLCSSKYYNNCIFHNVQKDMLVQTGDPTWTGNGGESLYAQLYGEQAKYFEGEPREHLTHAKAGTVSMAVAQRIGEKFFHGSQFLITTRDGQQSFDGKFTVFGRVVEGLDVLEKINETYTDDKGRPFRNIRIKHVVVLDDPFPDPPNWNGAATASPRYVPLDHRKEADDLMMEEANAGKTKEQIEVRRKWLLFIFLF